MTSDQEVTLILGTRQDQKGSLGRDLLDMNHSSLAPMGPSEAVEPRV